MGPRVVLEDGVRLRSHVSITGHHQSWRAHRDLYPGVALGGDGQIRGNDFHRRPAGNRAGLRAARDGHHACAAAARAAGITTVGDHGYFMANSHVGHDCRVGDDVTFANSVALGGHVEIGDGVIFGGLAAVQQFCRVGKGAMVGGLTGVNRDVIPYAMAFGDHVELAGLNLIGLKRRGLSRDSHPRHARHLPRRFFRRRRRLCRRTGARRARSAIADVPEVGEIVDFILADAKQELCLARRRGELRVKSAGPHRGRRRSAARRGRNRARGWAATCLWSPLRRQRERRLGQRTSRMNCFRRASRGASSRR